MPDHNPSSPTAALRAASRMLALAAEAPDGGRALQAAVAREAHALLGVAAAVSVSR